MRVVARCLLHVSCVSIWVSRELAGVDSLCGGSAICVMHREIRANIAQYSKIFRALRARQMSRSISRYVATPQIRIGRRIHSNQGSLRVLVTQAQHTLGELSLGVVSETAQTLTVVSRGILSHPARPVVLLLGRECSAWVICASVRSHAARVVSTVGYTVEAYPEVTELRRPKRCSPVTRGTWQGDTETVRLAKPPLETGECCWSVGLESGTESESALHPLQPKGASGCLSHKHNTL